VLVDWLEGQVVTSSSAPFCRLALFCQNKAKIGFVWVRSHPFGDAIGGSGLRKEARVGGDMGHGLTGL
jgi:hypothetical protein